MVLTSEEVKEILTHLRSSRIGHRSGTVLNIVDTGRRRDLTCFTLKLYFADSICAALSNQFSIIDWLLYLYKQTKHSGSESRARLKMYLRRREARSVILVHNPVGFGSVLVKHQNLFLTDFLAVTSLSLDRQGITGFLPKTRLGFPLLSLTFVIFAFLASEEMPNLITRRDPRLRWEITKPPEKRTIGIRILLANDLNLIESVGRRRTRQIPRIEVTDVDCANDFIDMARVGTTYIFKTEIMVDDLLVCRNKP